MDEEKLIILVREYTALYDMGDKNYLNQVVKNKCWKEISQQMRLPVPDCKERWSRIRDNFRKAIKFRIKKGGDPTTKIKPCKYENELSFLKPFLTERSQKTNLDAPNSPEPQNDETLELNEENDHFVDSRPPTPTSTCSQSSATQSLGIKNKCRVSASQNSVATALEKYLQVQTPHNAFISEGNTSLRQFFIAMADTVQSFPAMLQIEVKSKVFNVVQEAEIECLRQKDHGNVETDQSGIKNESASWT